MTSFTGFDWRGVNPNTGRLYAYNVVTQNGVPSSWKSQYQLQTYNFADDTTYPVNVNLQSGVQTGMIAGTLDLSGHTFSQTFFYVHIALPTGNGRLTFLSPTLNNGSFSFPVPTGSSVSLAFGGIQSGQYLFAFKGNLAPNGPSAQLKLASSFVQLNTPAANATGVDTSTMFSWTAPFSGSRRAHPGKRSVHVAGREQHGRERGRFRAARRLAALCR